MIRPQLLEVVGPWVGLFGGGQPGRSTRGLTSEDAGIPCLSARQHSSARLRAGSGRPPACWAVRGGNWPLSYAWGSRTIPSRRSGWRRWVSGRAPQRRLRPAVRLADSPGRVSIAVGRPV